MTQPSPAITVARGGSLRGELSVPGDKSITHRALICAALANGESQICGALDAADTRATATALAALGADIQWNGSDAVRVNGTGGQWRPPARPLDLGNSGTALRLLAGAIAGRGIAATLTGDASLCRRPMRRIADPLAAMGAVIVTDEGHPPVEIGRAGRLRGIHYRLSVASAQVKSALLLAALAAEGETRIEDPFGTRDHTERMLPLFGAALSGDGKSIAVQPGPLSAAELAVPGDLSAAAFVIAAVLLVPGSRLALRRVGVNPTRSACLAAFERMGARIVHHAEERLGNEPVADLEVTAGALRAIRLDAGDIPGLIDELPVLMVLAAAATGESVIEGAGELRRKESDRIEAMRAGLAALGVKISVQGERVTIPGGGFARGGHVTSAGDHRVAMALALAGLAAPQPVTVTDAGWIATSFPEFARTLSAAGAQVNATP